MDEEHDYKLIHSVDPRKVNVPIREKFAKLTLSNKKRTDQEQEQNDPQHMEQRKSASRNLMQFLQADDENSTQDNETTEESIDRVNSAAPVYTNPLLCSDSDETRLDETDLQQGSTVQSEADEMQPLLVSSELSELPLPCTQVERALNALSQRISLLTVSSNADRRQDEASVLVSTESQRMSTELHTTTQRLLMQPAQTSVKTENMDYIMLSSESEFSCDESSDGAITVSDTSASGSNVGDKLAFDFDAVTSLIPPSGETADAALPTTLSNERADRIEAFLRDVSLRRREMEQLGIPTQLKETVSNESVAVTTIDRKAQQIATADTESMSATEYTLLESVDERPAEIEVATAERKRDLVMAENDTLTMSNSASIGAISMRRSEEQMGEKSVNEDNSRRFANDDTEANTLITSPDRHPFGRQSDSTATEESAQDLPEESVIISETSSETPHHSPPRSSVADERNEKEGDEARSSQELVASEETTGESQMSDIQVGIGSINISAKINIKIQISQIENAEGSDESSETESDGGGGSGGDGGGESANDVKDHDDADDKNVESTRRSERQIQYPRHEVSPFGGGEAKAAEDKNKDDNFLTHAERLLNQLYGQSWKTPDVIRTLKRTISDSGSEANRDRISDREGENRNPRTAPVDETQDSEAMVEQSVLDDFSIFRKNIEKTNLDSTRLAAPRTKAKKKVTPRSEPRQRVKKPIESSRLCEAGIFKVPQTEAKKRLVGAKSTKEQRHTNWRQRVNDEADSSGDNASDDDSICKTDDDDDNSNVGKDESHASNDSDSDYEVERRRPNNRTRPSNRKTKKRGDRHDLTSREIERKSRNNALVYLDLSHDEVIVQEGDPGTPQCAANDDAKFNTRLQDILRTCKPEGKPKLPATPQTNGKTKRKLFTANFGVEADEVSPFSQIENDSHLGTPQRTRAGQANEEVLQELLETPRAAGCFDVVNKHLEALKRGTPIFKVTPPRIPIGGTPKRAEISKPKSNQKDANEINKTPQSSKGAKIDENARVADRLFCTPNNKYGFLKSLDVRVAKSLCHPDALYYRDNFRLRKEELTNILYELYNEKLFDNKLNVPLVWNKKLCNTAGRCLNKKKMGIRSCVVELSEKVLTSADRLRCTLLHELCHAATWIFNGEGGHGATWKKWAFKANSVFPEIPKIGVCHQYDIEYKYTYKCTLCAAKSHAHSKSKKVENIRCAYCHGAIEIFLNKKDKDGNIMPTPVKEATGFAKFVKDNYKQYKRPDLKHADIMKILSNEFASLKVNGNGNL